MWFESTTRVDGWLVGSTMHFFSSLNIWNLSSLTHCRLPWVDLFEVWVRSVRRLHPFRLVYCSRCYVYFPSRQKQNIFTSSSFEAIQWRMRRVLCYKQPTLRLARNAINPPPSRTIIHAHHIHHSGKFLLRTFQELFKAVLLWFNDPQSAAKRNSLYPAQQGTPFRIFLRNWHNGLMNSSSAFCRGDNAIIGVSWICDSKRMRFGRVDVVLESVNNRIGEPRALGYNGPWIPLGCVQRITSFVMPPQRLQSVSKIYCFLLIPDGVSIRFLLGDGWHMKSDSLLMVNCYESGSRGLRMLPAVLQNSLFQF